MKRAARTLSFLIALTATSFIAAQSDDRNQRTREFVVMGYQGLRIELTSGKGPYLRTLMDLLRTPTEAETKTTDQLKALLKIYPNIMDFADQVIMLGVKTEETAKIMAEVPVPSGPGIATGDKLVNALEHLTRGMAITVTLKTGEKLKGTYAEYTAKRLWIRGAARRSVHLDDILALESPKP